MMRAITGLSALLTFAIGLGGCGAGLIQSAPHPDRPEIASARVERNRVWSGCPIRLQLEFRDAEANVVRVLASWSYEGSASVAGRPIRVAQDGLAAVPLSRAALTGRQRGEAEIVLTPLQPGNYRYSVQIEDGAGHRSNVLEQAFAVLSQPAAQPVSCDDAVL